MNKYIPIGPEQRKKMMEVIGCSSFEDLLSPIPPSCLKDHGGKDLSGLPPAASEIEIFREFDKFSRLNHGSKLISFTGGGVYDHFIPAAVNHVLTRSEFYTAYTPYQAEVSQGTLQCIYEYQTMIARLCGLDIANASMYDGASAVAEAALLAMRATRKKRVLFSGAINPRWIDVIKTYLSQGEFELNEIPFESNGLLNTEALKKLCEGGIAATILQYPNYFGLIEDISTAAEITHENGGLLVAAADPVALAIIEAPGKLGADVVVGEGQSMGVPLSFGGPYVGFMAARRKLARRMPGRIVGATTDRAGQTGYVLTLQTREQHIRREKATSNICTNEALMALANTVFLTLAGEGGFREISLQCLQKSHYLYRKLREIDGIEQVFDKPFFREFVINFPISAEKLHNFLLEKGYFAGIPVPGLGDGVMLMTVTEKRTRAEIDGFVEIIKKCCSEGEM